MKKHPPDIETLFSIPSVAEYDVSKKEPGLVAFSWNKTGQWQIYLKTAKLGQAKQLTFDLESKLGPVLSPDCRQISFAKDYQGDENFDIFIMDIETGKTENVTPSTEYAIYPNQRFAPDGKRMTIVANQSGNFASYILNIDDRSLERITEHKYSDHYCEISPDGRKAIVASHVSAQDSGLFLSYMGESSKGLERLVDSKGKEIEADDPSWSPDGRFVAFVSASFGWYDIGVWDTDNKEVLWLTEMNREHYSPVFSDDSRKLAYLVNKGADVSLIIHDLSSNKRSEIKFRQGVISQPRFSGDGIYFIYEGSRNPPDLWYYHIKKQEFLQVTNSLPSDVDLSCFVDAGHVMYKCSKDGRDVPALLYIPNNPSGKLGALVEIHGGPTAQALNDWNPFVQTLVCKGVAVIRPNYRGSTGYGREHREANRFVMGDLDLADCASAWQYLVEQGIAGKDSIAVAGGSFGGYLTMCALTKYPDLWACGVSIVPFLNWFTEIKNERDDLRYWDLHNMGDPDDPKDAERLRNASPIFFMDRVKAPVMIIAGANDPRCPIEEAEQAKRELERLGKEVQVKFYKDEGHGFRKMKNRVDAYSSAIAFLMKYLNSKRS